MSLHMKDCFASNVKETQKINESFIFRITKNHFKDTLRWNSFLLAKYEHAGAQVSFCTSKS